MNDIIDYISASGTEVERNARDDGANESVTLVQQPKETARSAMEQFGIACTKELLLKWFYNQCVQVFVDADQFFGKKVFDCFYVDVKHKVIAFRLAEGVGAKKFFEDDYERLLSRDNLESTTQVAVYTGVPLEQEIFYPHEKHGVMMCDRKCDENEFLINFPDALDLSNLQDSVPALDRHVRVQIGDFNKTVLVVDGTDKDIQWD